jgi:hypothetical protein
MKYLNDNDKPSTTIKTVSKYTKGTKRYSFEITPQLQDELEKAVIIHTLMTGKRVSTSSVIRQALKDYLKGVK